MVTEPIRFLQFQVAVLVDTQLRRSIVYFHSSVLHIKYNVLCSIRSTHSGKLHPPDVLECKLINSALRLQLDYSMPPSLPAVVYPARQRSSSIA